MDEQLRKFLSADKFPCLMAKSVMKKGLVNFHEISGEDSIFDILDRFENFLNDYHEKPGRLSSFMLRIPDGTLKVLPPKSIAGDHIVFEALEDLLVGVTACSALQSNIFSFKPIGYEISEPSSIRTSGSEVMP